MIPAQFTGIPAVLRTIPRNLSKIRIIKTISHSESWNIQNPGMNTKRLLWNQYNCFSKDQ